MKSLGKTVQRVTLLLIIGLTNGKNQLAAPQMNSLPSNIIVLYMQIALPSYFNHDSCVYMHLDEYYC